MKSYTLLLALLTVSFTLIQCDEGALTGTTTQALEPVLFSSAENESLLFMIEEEKLARDVYITLGERFNLKVFANIQLSEQKHMDAVENLLLTQELPLPSTLGQIGTFENEELQSLYTTLIQQGSVSDTNALAAGALIEEVDIRDLQELLDTTITNGQIITVYQNLIAGSENHLRAFVRNLSNRGIHYVPKILTQEQFDTIIS
jgi:hypothetical protein